MGELVKAWSDIEKLIVKWDIPKNINLPHLPIFKLSDEELRVAYRQLVFGRQNV